MTAEEKRLQDLFVLTALECGRRENDKQKKKASMMIRRAMQECGVETKDVCMTKGYTNMRHLFINDPLHKKNIIIAGFDTPRTSVLPFFRYIPFHPAVLLRRHKQELAAVIAVSLLLFIPAVWLFAVRKMVILPCVLMLVSVILSGGYFPAPDYSFHKAASIALRIAEIRCDTGVILADEMISELGIEELLRKYPELKTKHVILIPPVNGEGRFVTDRKTDIEDSVVIKDLFRYSNFQMIPDIRMIGFGETADGKFVLSDCMKMTDKSIDFNMLNYIIKISESILSDDP